MLINKIMIILAAISIGAVLAILSCSSKQAERIEEFEQVVNSHNVDSILSYYAEDFQLQLGGAVVAKKREDMRPLTMWDAEVKSISDYKVLDIHGDTVLTRKTEQSEWLKLFGIDTARFEPWIFIYENGKIKKMMGAPTRESALAMERAFNEVKNWATVTHPELLEELMPEGKFIYEAEVAFKWIALLQEWNQVKEQYGRKQ